MDRKYTADRMQKRRLLEKEREERKKKKIRRFLWTALAFFFLLGLMQVDRGYSEMTDERAMLIPAIRRINEEEVRFSGLGASVEVNVKEIFAAASEVADVFSPNEASQESSD